MVVWVGVGGVGSFIWVIVGKVVVGNGGGLGGVGG